jgi:hypothetical protein
VWFLALVLVLHLIFPTGNVPYDLIGNLLFGWILVLGRTGDLSINWNGVALAAVCVILLFMGLHQFLTWFFRHRPAPVEGQEQRVWHRRWTAAILCAVLLTCTAGIAATGLIHETVSLMKSHKLLTRDPARDDLLSFRLTDDLRQVAVAAQA